MDVSDHLVRAIDHEHKIRVATTLTTTLVAEGARRHGLSIAATCAVGRALTSGLLLATLTKGQERVTIQLSGDGPLGSITVDAHGDGTARGYARYPAAQIPLPAGRPQLADLIGKNGFVHVLRDLGLKELYQGQVAMTAGEIDEDIEVYLRSSEQVPSALGAEVVLAEGGGVQVAGGILVQALPGGEPEAVLDAQRALRAGRLFELLAAGERSAQALSTAIYPVGTLEFIGEVRSLRFQCRCSPKRITEMLALLGTVDLDEMIAEGKPAEVVCNYCNERYQVDRPELERIRATVVGRRRQSN